jgi:hypothetical protein
MKHSETIIGITLVLASLIIVIGVIIVCFNNIPELWKEECISLGGNYWEIQNVTCAIGHRECFRMCSLNGKTLGYYDFGSLCVEDCRYENNKSNGLRCVC